MKKTIFIALFVILFVIILGAVDSFRFFTGKEPLFILKKVDYKDGGTTFYFGPGYELMGWHIAGYDDVKQKPFYYTKKELRLFPFFKFRYSLEDIDKSDYLIQYE